MFVCCLAFSSGYLIPAAGLDALLVLCMYTVLESWGLNVFGMHASIFWLLN